MNKKLRVLFVSAEISPWAKSGELADVIQALSRSISILGAEVSLILPKYRLPEIESLPLEMVIPELSVPLGQDKIKASVYKTEVEGCAVYFIDNPKYFCRDKIYGSAQADYLDNDERFTFFSRAVVEFLIKAKLAVDIIHCNDWPTALVPLFLRTHYAQKSFFKDTATVISVHDLASQRKFPPESLALTGLNWDYFTPEQLALNGKFSFLKAGLIFSDALNTAGGEAQDSSWNVPAENKQVDLEDILLKRPEAIFSIANGIDRETWELAAKKYIELYEKALDAKRGG